VISRIREGLNDVPISRTGSTDWGIAVPGDAEHTIYVWIDALMNYLTTVDTDQRRHFWPADVHVIAKDILWFHAVIWPAVLMAMKKRPGYEWVELPRQVYAHSFWIAEGQKMSKSLGNFIDLEKIDHYVQTFGLDALRYYLATYGPMGATDADFVEARFIEVYNSELANTVGNCSNRVINMTGRYFDGKVPAHGPHVEASAQYGHSAEQAVTRYRQAMDGVDIAGAVASALDLIRAVDSYIEKTAPFKLAKDPANLPQVGTILYNCAEAVRIASLLLWPMLPQKMEELWRRLGCTEYATRLADRGRGDLDAWTRWGGLQPGTPVEQGSPLFPRYQK
jgi:methionyl-tRNA synthetase